MKTDNTIYLIGRIRERANSFLLKELSRIGFTDLAPSHGDILAALFQHKELTMTQIANNIHRDRSTVTTLVNKLINLGYIAPHKDPNDSRSTIISLTEKGKKLEPDFQEISQKLNVNVYAGISVDEREAFQKVLNKIYDNLG
ncbi:MAG: MarR family transcriptional regulator [Thermincola sp.]|nr:MarR family transcriptional regulator [Thermincola sp.]MDT3702013.1 MarR family transcriptional regulator [Thermincola sp.]